MNLILVGLDESPRASEVLQVAVDLAQRTGAKLLLVRAVGLPPNLPPEALAIAPDRLPDILERNARESLQRLAREVPAPLLAGIRVQIGTAWQLICRLAREANADLIVIGSHGYGGIDRLLGTTAARVVNHADQSVLVARPRHAT